MVPSQKSSKAADTDCVVSHFEVTPSIPVSRDISGKRFQNKCVKSFNVLPVEHNWLETQIVWETNRLGNRHISQIKVFYLNAYYGILGIL